MPFICISFIHIHANNDIKYGIGAKHIRALSTMNQTLNKSLAFMRHKKNGKQARKLEEKEKKGGWRVGCDMLKGRTQRATANGIAATNETK